jgi:hypothetical protein
MVHGVHAMINRRWLFIPTLLAAGAVPFAIFDDGLSSLSQGRFPAMLGGDGNGQSTSSGFFGMGGSSSTLPTGNAVSPFASASGVVSQPANATLEGAPVDDLSEILRFDISPRWVTSRWARVSTVLSELQLEGLRVPVVTGTNEDDIAGSLTYYFDKQQQVQRIALQGYTGNERKLVALLTEHHGFRAEPTLGAGMYLTRWNGKPTSAMRISHAPVIQAGSPHSRLEVRLEINRPSAYYGLSGEFAELLNRDRQTRRW